MLRRGYLSALFTLLIWQTSAWQQAIRESAKSLTSLAGTKDHPIDFSRRAIVQQAFVASTLIVAPSSCTAVTRAIGGAEEECRAAGNCLEIGEWDGAIGWSWGSRDRCDPSDPLCGTDGKIRDQPLTGEAVPDVTNKVTHVVEMTYSVGRGESGVLRMGLYGFDAKDSVEQFLQFMTRGLRTTSNLAFESGMGVETVPVSFTRGGILANIVPSQRLDFGIPLQSAAYARSKGLSRVSEAFMAQPRPIQVDEPILRLHTVAGLVSIPGKGLGWGGTGFETDDECFESSFQITAAPCPSMDKKEGRRVIGQLMDQESMSNLARLATLPTKKGFKGVIPGQNAGPPLLKVPVAGISVTPLVI
jgi:hypothetical protein